MNDNYGIKGRVRRLEQRKQWGFSDGPLSHVPNFDSYDVEFCSTRLVLAKTFYTHSGAVHRSTRFEYNCAGQLVHSEEFDRQGQKLKISELVYAESKCKWRTYDASGTTTSHGVDEYEGTNLVLSSSYDSKGNLKTLKSFEYEEGKLSRSVSKYFGCDGTVSEQWMATCDEAGRIAKTFGVKADGSPLGDGKYAYEYDQEGRRIKVWTFSDWEDVASSVTVSEYTNDAVGNWVKRQDFHHSKSDSRWRKTTTTRTLSYFSDD